MLFKDLQSNEILSHECKYENYYSYTGKFSDMVKYKNGYNTLSQTKRLDSETL